MTDENGLYELTEMPAGRFFLRATRGGYVEVAYGQMKSVHLDGVDWTKARRGRSSCG
jgi:hypothetical protein